MKTKNVIRACLTLVLMVSLMLFPATSVQAGPGDPPIITSFFPTSGIAGTTIYISGYNLTGATGVTVGGTAATNPTVSDDNFMTAVVGSGANGKVAVVTASGTGTSHESFTFVTRTYATPQMNAASYSAETDSSYNVALGDLNGDGFVDAFVANYSQPNRIYLNNHHGAFTLGSSFSTDEQTRSVALGDLDGDGDLDAFLANDATHSRYYRNNGSGVFTLVGTLADGVDINSYDIALGDLDGDGDLDAFIANRGDPCRVWLNTPKPVVTSFEATATPAVAGTTVTITGSFFTGATAVKFGAADAASFVVDSDTQITAVVGDGANGSITVTTPAGDSNALSGFTFSGAPVITSLSPDTRSTTGTVTIDIYGYNFRNSDGDPVVIHVHFGEETDTYMNVLSDTEVAFASTAHAAGAVDVWVSTATVDSNKVSLTYVAGPTLDALATASGPVAGGQTITLTGTGFIEDDTTVSFGVSAGTVTFVSATELSVVTPAHAAGQVDVTVTTTGGTSAARTYTYLAIPTVTGVNPTAGPVAGGDTVIVSGTAFTGATEVTFDGINAASYTVDSATQITAVTPAHAAGAAQVVVTTPGGSSTDAVNFTYMPIPTVTSLDVSQGATAGGTTVVITGTGFTGATAVAFGGTGASSFTVDSATQITAVTPAHAAGAAQVVVTTPGGPSTDAVNFTYIGPPTVTNVNPAGGLIAGGDTVVITGTAFTGATAVTFGGTNATSYTVDSDTQITAVNPAHALGIAEVVVTTDYGTSTVTEDFIYYSVTPASGDELGGDTVVFAGANFTGATAVTFDGTNATSYNVDSDTQITAVTPAHAIGPVDVVVTTPGGTATITNGFTYVAHIGEAPESILPGPYKQMASDPQEEELPEIAGQLTPVVGEAGTTGVTGNAIQSPVHAANFLLGWTSTNTELSNSVALADFDSDGDLDAYVANFGQVNRIYYNDGTGNFDSSTTTGTNRQSYSVSAGDLDNDGHPDVFIANLGTPSEVYLNDGAGHFHVAGDPADYNTPFNDEADAILLGDMDGDGDLDAYITCDDLPGNGTYHNRLFLNDGDGTFTLSSTSDIADHVWGADIADLDNDGDLDVYAACNGGANRVYLNALAPDVTGFTPTSAKKGASVVIAGTNLNGANAVSFGGTAATSFTVNSDIQITATVSTGASGAVSVTTPGGTDTMAGFTFKKTTTSTGGGGGGGGAPPVLQTNLNGSTQTFQMDYNGRLTQNVNVKTPDGLVNLVIPANTTATYSNGGRMSSLSVTPKTNPPAPPEGKNIIGLVYDFTPNGSKFNPYATITLTFDPAALPDRVTGEQLVLAFYDETAKKWVELPSTYNAANHTISANVTHFTSFTLIGTPRALTPAAFAVSGLTITPEQVQFNGKVTIKALVTNSGETAGTYTADLMINSVKEASKELTVEPGAAAEAAFELTGKAPGKYTVKLGDQEGQFTVAAQASPTATTAPTSPSATKPASPTMTTTPASPTIKPVSPPPSTSTSPSATTLTKTASWPLIVGIIGGVIVILLIMVLILRNRRRSSGS